PSDPCARPRAARALLCTNSTTRARFARADLKGGFMRVRERVRVQRGRPPRVATHSLPGQTFALAELLDVARATLAGRTWRILWGDWRDSALFAPGDSRSTEGRK